MFLVSYASKLNLTRLTLMDEKISVARVLKQHLAFSECS